MSQLAYDYDSRIPAGFYDQIHRRGRGVRYCWHDLKFRAVAARLGGARRLLDVGCGPGTFIGNYAGGIEALGIDASAEQIGYATRHYGSACHRFEVRAAAEVVATGERFDAVTMIELIEHLPATDVRDLLPHVRSLLAPAGTLVVTTPNYASPWPLIEWGVNRTSRVSYELQHINKYRRARLAAELREAGFRAIAIGTAVGFAPFAAMVGVGAARAVNALEAGLGHLGCGNLLIASARA
jgi:2-polyprenyl-3-methyl-5-hydroxy-6-metoxy-1,4-benzoquinol methylase